MHVLLASIGAASALTAGDANWTTNYPGVFQVVPFPFTTYVTNVYPARPNELEPRVRILTNTVWFTNNVFSHYVSGSFPEQVWTNFIARTNGRRTTLWLDAKHPADWPKTAPIIRWNRNSLIYGLHGFTGLSPCWAGEPSHGQTAITALTRRHGYTRGHGMGPSGLGNRFAGKSVWFLTDRDRLVRVKVLREVVRTTATDQRDYTLLLFDRDLPGSIQPLEVGDVHKLQALSPHVQGGPRPLFKTEQLGHVSADVPGFSYDTWKAGDSGCPDMLLRGDSLVFLQGRSTSGPSPEMQADMDELCREERLDPRKYQMRWVSIGQ